MAGRSRSEAPLRSPKHCSAASLRCSSVDETMHWFSYPDGDQWCVPASWGIRERLNRKPVFRTSAYLTFEPSSSEIQIPTGWVLEDVPLKMIEKPQRHSNVGQRWNLDPERLLSVLDAMLEGVVLPPVRAEDSDGCGPLRVANGFHRYFASLALGYLELPMLCPRPPARRSAAIVNDAALGRLCSSTSLLLDGGRSVAVMELKPRCPSPPRSQRHTVPQPQKFVPRAVRLRQEEARKAQARRDAFTLDMQRTLADQDFCRNQRNRRAVTRMRCPRAGLAWAEVAKRTW